VGDADYTRQVLSELGQMDFWQVAIKPGKPFAFGWLNRAGAENHNHIQPVWLFGLPGNPVSAAVTCEQLLIPALQLLSGQQVQKPVLWPAKAAQGLRKKPGRLDMQRVCLQVSSDGIKAESVGADSSGMLSSLMHADALTWLEQQRSDVEPGEDIWVQPKSCWWL
jgi:molybdopterin molybdotransferase